MINYFSFNSFCQHTQICTQTPRIYSSVHPTAITEVDEFQFGGITLVEYSLLVMHCAVDMTDALASASHDRQSMEFHRLLTS